jgi:hypothetical protein
MEYNEVKDCLMACPDLAGLDEPCAAALFWRGLEKRLEAGTVVYAESEKLDSSFGLLLFGDLLVERAGEVLGGISERQIFGEMAYFNDQHERNATIRVGSPLAVILQFHLTSYDLASPEFSALKRCLSLQTWDKFVNSSQAQALEMCGADI